jgi:hypothetical protein
MKMLINVVADLGGHRIVKVIDNNRKSVTVTYVVQVATRLVSIQKREKGKFISDKIFAFVDCDDKHVATGWRVVDRFPSFRMAQEMIASR